MPILVIEVVGPLAIERLPSLAQKLADAAGRVFAAPSGTTWVRVRSVPLDAYAENDASLPAAEAPVFVQVLKRRVPDGAELAAEIGALTLAIADVVGRSASRVHVGYEPPAAGRMAFGGTLVD